MKADNSCGAVMKELAFVACHLPFDEDEGGTALNFTASEFSDDESLSPILAQDVSERGIDVGENDRDDFYDSLFDQLQTINDSERDDMNISDVIF